MVLPSVKQHGRRIAYIDLFAGPGRYEDGTLSTPLRVLRGAIEHGDMRKMLVTVFNDKDASNVGKLKAAIKGLPGIEKLAYQPQISNEIVGEELAKMFARLRMVSTFFFVDPWGYKGLSLGLINSVLQNWGCDCVFFFNYNRVNMGLNNESVREHMNVLFGEERANRLRNNLRGLSPEDRENLILEELSQALKELGGNYVLPFSFKDEKGKRTSHHLIFVTKHFKGYEIMKEIMAKESSDHVQGVPSFEFSPVKERFQLLFELSRPLDDLAEALLDDFAGKKINMQGIYMRHSIDRRYIRKNYKQALLALEAEGKILTDPPAEDRRMYKGERTFAEGVMVTFPKKKKV